MKMADVRVGMILRDVQHGYLLTVTEITQHGFKYSYDDVKPFIARLGWTIAKDGHEHYGLNGEVVGYELVAALASPPQEAEK